MNGGYEANLVEAVEKNSILWDPANMNYKNRQGRQIAWAQVASIVGGDAKQCQSKFKSIRDKYVKRKSAKQSIPSGSGTASTRLPKWELETMLFFLDQSIAPRKTVSNFKRDGPFNVFDEDSSSVPVTGGDNTEEKIFLLDEDDFLFEEDVPSCTLPLRESQINLHRNVASGSQAPCAESPVSTPRTYFSGVARPSRSSSPLAIPPTQRPPSVASTSTNSSLSPSAEGLTFGRGKKVGGGSNSRNKDPAVYELALQTLLEKPPALPVPPRPLGDNEHFGSVVTNTLNRLPAKKAAELRMRISAILFEAEYGSVE